MPLAEIAILTRTGEKVCSFTLDDDPARRSLHLMVSRYDLKPIPAGKRWICRYSGLPGTDNEKHILAYRIVPTSKLRHIEARADEVFTKTRHCGLAGG